MISLRSKIAKKLLIFLFFNDEKSYYINELVKILKLDKRNLIKKINELEVKGLLKTEYLGNLRFVKINKKYPLFKEYKAIIMKTIGLESKLKTLINKYNTIAMIIIFGSYASNEMDIESDIDVLIVGSHNIIDLQKEILKLQRELQREFNVINMSENEFKTKKKDKDPFITEILRNKYILTKKDNGK